jgi:hypothetical protein
MAYLTLLAGLLLSVTAAYYSIAGLVAIFPGAAVAVIAMGVSLEFAKLVMASWLYRNWHRAPTSIKASFSVLVVVLMFFTSMGIFGFLSKAHIEHTVTAGADTTYQTASVEQQVVSKQKTISLLERQLDLIDASTAKYIESGKVNDGIKQRNRLKSDRKALERQRSETEAELVELQTKLSLLKADTAKKEAEVGPLKYIAELVYGDNAKDHFDSAVRGVIILIVFIFDPSAVLLLIAANMNFVRHRKKRKKKVAFSAPQKYNNEKDYVVMKNSEFDIQHTKDIP